MPDPSPAVGPVVVWCDVGPERGVGHVMRCVALAEELDAQGLDVVFCAALDTVDFARSAVESRGFRWVAPHPEEDTRVGQVAELAPVAVVVDSYATEPGTYRALRARWPLLAFVDGDTAGVDGDLLLDQNIGAELDPWPLPAGATRLAGLDHALMREEIRAGRALGRELERDPGRARGSADLAPSVFAFFGGTDAFAAAPVAAAALLETGRPVRLRVVGARPETVAALEALPAGPGQHLDVIAPTGRLVEEVHAADLVVSACGTSSWELLCLGAACAFVSVTGNQDQAYDRVVASGVAAGLGHLEQLRLDRSRAVAALDGLLGDPGARASLRRSAAAMVDGRGRERVVAALLATSRRRGTVPLV